MAKQSTAWREIRDNYMVENHIANYNQLSDYDYLEIDSRFRDSRKTVEDNHFSWEARVTRKWHKPNNYRF